ncbi:hypothetical protein OEZ60_16960 [Defluviimonas sp. WL0024]|uniref:Uncharacterized protein n=2 Tax=Albidovulum TaxID=205889 RepID=A0ABT3IZB7_9RHOB|nr:MULTISPECIES: hypothetical protein [Defluviimonas]MCU9849692.1 hypothetical protein [Defluviimonas sp. WL0024]MCW3780779.1 hypothetical protein [Defluviimonas salinarum]
MSDIAEMERRISAALERIGAGVEKARAEAEAAAAAREQARTAGELREALEAERAANAQLTDRVRAIKEKQETMVDALEKKVARLTEQLDAAGAELHRQKRINADLTEAQRALREAAQDGVPEPEQINRSLMAELEALRAARAAEMAEMQEILSELRPLIEEVA